MGKGKMNKLLGFYTDNTFKCKCGHSVVIYPDKKKKLCTWCNNYVYRDKKEEFKDNFKRKEKESNGK